MVIHRKTSSLNTLLKEFNNDISAITVVDLVSRLGDKMNKTTIYRILNKLEEDSILHSFFGKNGLKWYAKCDGCCNSKPESILNKFRPHFQCLSCGKIDRLNVEMKLPKVTDQKVSVSQLLIQGRCESCN